MQLMIQEFLFLEKVPTKPSPTSVFWQQGDFFLGQQKRVATVTDVKFINDSRLLVAHRAAAKLYMIELQNDQLIILDELRLDTIKIKFGIKKLFNEKRFFHPDLITLKDQKIYMTEYSERCGVVEICDSKLRFTQLIEFKSRSSHGCYAEEKRVLFGSVNCDSVMSYRENGLPPIAIRLGIEKNKRIKAIGKDHLHYLVAADKLTGSTKVKGTHSDAWIYLFDLQESSAKQLDCYPLIDTQIEAHKYYKGLHYFTIQRIDAPEGEVLVFRVEGERLIYVDSIPCQLFPHGLDIRNDRLAYTCYDRSSVIIRNLPPVAI